MRCVLWMEWPYERCPLNGVALKEVSFGWSGLIRCVLWMEWPYERCPLDGVAL